MVIVVFYYCHNKSPQIYQPKTTSVHYLTVPGGQNLNSLLSVCQGRNQDGSQGSEVRVLTDGRHFFFTLSMWLFAFSSWHEPIKSFSGFESVCLAYLCFKGAWDFIGSTWIIHDTLLILESIV